MNLNDTNKSWLDEEEHEWLDENMAKLFKGPFKPEGTFFLDTENDILYVRRKEGWEIYEPPANNHL